MGLLSQLNSWFKKKKKTYLWPVLKYQSPILRISFSNFSTYHNYYQFDLLENVYVCMFSCFNCVQLFVTIWTVACQAPLSMGLSRQEYWSGLPCPPIGYLPNPGIKPRSPALHVNYLPLGYGGNPLLVDTGPWISRTITFWRCYSPDLHSHCTVLWSSFTTINGESVHLVINS